MIGTVGKPVIRMIRKINTEMGAEVPAPLAKPVEIKNISATVRRLAAALGKIVVQRIKTFPADSRTAVSFVGALAVREIGGKFDIVDRVR